MILNRQLRNVINPLFLFSFVIALLFSRISFSQNNLKENKNQIEADTLSNIDVETLLENQNDENDLLDSLNENYYTFGLFGKIGYTSDMQYRGYQGDGTHSAFFPGLLYNNPIGLGVFLKVYNIKGTAVPWDEIEMGASYSHNFSERLSISLSYTHYIFTDTSEISIQGINDIVGVSLSYDFSLLSAGSSFDISFGDQTDYSFGINLSKRIELAKRISFQSWLEPGFSGVYGTESLLINRIANKMNGKSKIVKGILTTTTNNVFSVLAYQLSIPLTVELGRFIITPQFDYIIPLNQPPSTNSNPFSFFSMNISVKIF